MEYVQLALCMIHKEALAVKEISPGLKNTLTIAVIIENYVKRGV